jgi:hypothetical protein
MTMAISDAVAAGTRRGELFRIEASQVLESLRNRVADVLSDLGDFSKPAEVQRALLLDKTLSRQVFKLACNSEPMANGNIVPSQTSIHRFLEVAKGRGIDNEKIQGVLTAYKQFDDLIRTHAGDRATFNSMVSAATGVDDEWLAADLQHRRNAFRTMSHTMGMQIKTRMMLFVINSIEEGQAYQLAVISGCIGLRVLRQMPSVRIHGAALGPLGDSNMPSWEPLGLNEGPSDDLLEPFCTKPLPDLKVTNGNDEFGKWHQVAIEQPEIGNLGTTTLFFGSLCRRIPIGSEPLRVHSSNRKPAEVVLFDVLIDPRIASGGKPVSRGVLGQNERYGSEIIPLQGKFNPELLGRGPAALSTPEVPRYAEMLGAISQKIGLNLTDFNAWRLRLEYPLYQSTFSMSWETVSPNL